MSARLLDWTRPRPDVGFRTETRRHLLVLAPLFVGYVLVTLLAPHTSSDESAYLRYAENLSHGFYSGRGDEIDLWFGPGMPILLVPFSALESPIEISRLLGPVLAFATVVLFYFCLRLTISSSAALSGALTLGLYLPLLPLLPTLHSEIPAMFFVVCFMTALTLDVRKARSATFAAAAASLALLAVTRIVFGWVLVVALALVLASLVVRRSRVVKRTAAIVAIGLVLTTPWLAYTYDVAGKAFYWGTSGGLSLYWMSSPYPGEHGDWHAVKDALADRSLARHRPFFESVRGLDQVAFDRAMTRRALQTIRRHPLDYVENVAANMSRLWFSTPYSYTPQRLSTTFYIVPNAFVLAGLIAAAAVFLRLRTERPEAFGFTVLLIPGIGLQALLAAYPRMLVPLVPLMLWFIVQAAVELVRGRDEHRGFATAP